MTVPRTPFNFLGEFTLCKLLRIYSQIFRDMVASQSCLLTVDQRPKLPFLKTEDIHENSRAHILKYDPHYHLYVLFHYVVLIQHALTNGATITNLTNKNSYYRALNLLALMCGWIIRDETDGYFVKCKPSSSKLMTILITLSQ